MNVVILIRYHRIGVYGHLLIHSFLFTRRWSSIRKEDPMNVVNRSLLRGHFEVTTIKPVSPGGLFYGLAVRRDHVFFKSLSYAYAHGIF